MLVADVLVMLSDFTQRVVGMPVLPYSGQVRTGPRRARLEARGVCAHEPEGVRNRDEGLEHSTVQAVMRHLALVAVHLGLVAAAQRDGEARACTL